MDCEFDERFPSIEKSHLTNITPSIKYLWVLRKSFSFSDHDATTKYALSIFLVSIVGKLDSLFYFWHRLQRRGNLA